MWAPQTERPPAVGSGGVGAGDASAERALSASRSEERRESYFLGAEPADAFPRRRRHAFSLCAASVPAHSSAARALPSRWSLYICFATRNGPHARSSRSLFLTKFFFANFIPVAIFARFFRVWNTWTTCDRRTRSEREKRTRSVKQRTRGSYIHRDFEIW